jgi:hypothetical protein
VSEAKAEAERAEGSTLSDAPDNARILRFAQDDRGEMLQKPKIDTLNRLENVFSFLFNTTEALS